MKPSVLVGGKLPSSVMARLEEACDVDRVEGGTPTHDELIARIPGKSALVSMITNTVDRALIEAGRDLRIVANVAVGYNNVDVAAARERGILVTNTPDVLTGATADFTWALILGITRRLGEGERLVRRGAWKGWAFDFMLATELRGKQLGIVGSRPHRPGGRRPCRGIRHDGGAHVAIRWRHVLRSPAVDVGRRVAARAAHA